MRVHAYAGHGAFADLHSVLGAVCSLAIGAASLSAQGGGLAASEFGVPANGASLAGQSALASDPSTVYLNPAGMTRLEGTQLLVGAQVEYLKLKFRPAEGTTVPGGGGDNAGGWLPGGSLFLTHRVSADWTVGLSAVVPFGNGIGHSDDWAGRYSLVEGKLAVLDLQPSVAVRVAEGLSIGVGLNVQYAALRQTLSVDQSGAGLADDFYTIEEDGFGFGATAGLLYEPVEGTRIGLKYRSELRHDLQGTLDAESGFSTDASISFVFPHAVNLGVYQRIGERWALIGDVGWSDWSSFEPVPFQDTWRVGVGAHFYASDRWTLQSGFSWDSSAATDEGRTPLVPTDRHYRFSAGAEYRFGDTSRVGMSGTYADLGSAFLDSDPDPSGGRVTGDYDASKSTLGFYVVLGF